MKGINDLATLKLELAVEWSKKNTLKPTEVSVVIFAVFLYFISIRPQKKQQKKIDAMLSTLEVGDSILTTSGLFAL